MELHRHLNMVEIEMGMIDLDFELVKSGFYSPIMMCEMAQAWTFRYLLESFLGRQRALMFSKEKTDLVAFKAIQSVKYIPFQRAHEECPLMPLPMLAQSQQVLSAKGMIQRTVAESQSYRGAQGEPGCDDVDELSRQAIERS